MSTAIETGTGVLAARILAVDWREDEVTAPSRAASVMLRARE